MSEPSKPSKLSQPRSTPSTSSSSSSSHQQQQPPPNPTPPRSPPPPYVPPSSRPITYLLRALRAASFPLRGILYFSTPRRGFWPLFIARLVPLSIISLLVYLVLFAVAFVPQYAFLAIFHGWGAWVNAVVLVLAEGLVIIQGLFEGFFVDECRVNIFDATLIDKNHTSLVSPHRLILPPSPSHPSSPIHRLGPPSPSTPAVFTPWSLTQLAELVLFLPLNLVPVVGTPAFILITGSRLGKLCHHRWFVLRGLSRDEVREEIRRREWEYLWFGAVAMVLELVPVLSLFFLLTTAAGAALWAAREEDDARRRGEGVDGVDGEGEYRDDPV